MLDSGTSYSPGNYRFGWDSDLTSIEKSGRDRRENSASSSQVWHRDDNPFPSTERSGREMTQRSCTGKMVREVQNQHSEMNLNHHSLEISILDTLRKSSRMFDKSRIVPIAMKVAIHLGENFHDNLVTFRNTHFEALKTFFDITQELILNQKHEIKRISK